MCLTTNIFNLIIVVKFTMNFNCFLYKSLTILTKFTFLLYDNNHDNCINLNILGFVKWNRGVYVNKCFFWLIFLCIYCSCSPYSCLISSPLPAAMTSYGSFIFTVPDSLLYWQHQGSFVTPPKQTSRWRAVHHAGVLAHHAAS